MEWIYLAKDRGCIKRHKVSSFCRTYWEFLHQLMTINVSKLIICLSNK